MSFLKHISGTQRGAMFGLDARIALAIMAALGIVAGASMVQILKDRRVDNLLFEQERYTTAIEAMQEDIETHIHNSLTTSNDANAFLALTDGTLLTAALQPQWLGPYVPEIYSTNHLEYGVYSLAQREVLIANTCSDAERRARQCYYWLTISLVPINTVTELNASIDGTAEATPQSEGNIQWDTITATNARVYMRLGLVMAP